jgi:hypothetical protein
MKLCDYTVALYSLEAPLANGYHFLVSNVSFYAVLEPSQVFGSGKYELLAVGNQKNRRCATFRENYLRQEKSHLLS